MKKSKTNVSVVSNVGIRRNVNVHVGDNGSFPSGDILDANATKQLVDNVADSIGAAANTADLATVATTGSYNDLTNKPTIPNVAVVNIEMEDLNTSTSPFTIINQNKISQVCDLIDAGTVVFGTFSNMGPNMTAIWAIGGQANTTATLYMDGFTPLVQPNSSPFGGWMVYCSADVTSRYVTSNTGS